MQIQVSIVVRATQPRGAPIKSVREAVYLGGLITCGDRVSHEASRRLGESKRISDSLSQAWPRAGITRNRKFKLYNACVVSKLLYSLGPVWLLQLGLRRLDGFHARCLRIVLHIPCSYSSRYRRMKCYVDLPRLTYRFYSGGHISH